MNLLIGLFLITAQAESILPPCYRYSYDEAFALEKGAPSELKLEEGRYLSNSSAKELIVEVDENHCAKLVNGRYFEAHACEELKSAREASKARARMYTNVRLFAKNRTLPDPALFGANEAPPPKPASYRFTIAAKLGGKSIQIPVQGSYVLKELNCER